MKKRSGRMNRREFLKQSGVGSIALALPSLAPIVARPALDDEDGDEGRANFHVLSLSQGGVVDGVDHRIIMAGTGKFGPQHVTGGGSFTHFDGASPVPQTVLASGIWRAKRLISFTEEGEWGSQFISGMLEMTVILVAEFPSRAVVPATLLVNCNIGPAGLSTGLPEGFFLTIEGAPFSPFEPATFPDTGFPFGLTLFTKGVRVREDD